MSPEWEAKAKEMVDQLDRDHAIRKMSDMDRAKLAVQKMDQALQLLSESRLIVSLNIPSGERQTDDFNPKLNR
jgi:hypothetical protein